MICSVVGMVGLVCCVHDVRAKRSMRVSVDVYGRVGLGWEICGSSGLRERWDRKMGM